MSYRCNARRCIHHWMIPFLYSQQTHSLEATALPALMDSTYLMFAAVRYLAALRPDTRPKTTQSNKELPPSLLLPWMPPAASPAEYKPPITRSPPPNDSASPLIRIPPMQ
mmetsp:Transcript_138790/g.276772  ORF Transcript_138790/g.276772 Transcript_138790/m.276772 type:complete len:110 (-) Transcript_138790:9-338(-)